ncbi:MAG TPA: hypothetical protein VF058_09215 [Actinomycetota bacterium]
MNPYGELLERAGRRFPPPDAGLDDLHDRLRRRRRGRRIVAGAVSLALFVGTAAALGSRIPFVGSERSGAPADVDVVVSRILPDRVPPLALKYESHRGTEAMTGLVVGDTLVRLASLPATEGATRVFQRNDPLLIVAVLALRFEDARSAQIAYALLEGDVRRGDPDAPTVTEPDPRLGVESVALVSASNRRYRGARTTALLWQRGDLVMGALTIGRAPRERLERIARDMDDRAQTG